MPTDEFGVATGSTQPGSLRYGWQGAQQTAGDTPGGVMLMGARVYNPTTGRFLQADRVKGGSSNDYDYADQDPVNQSDPTGFATCGCGYLPSRAGIGYQEMGYAYYGAWSTGGWFDVSIHGYWRAGCSPYSTT